MAVGPRRTRPRPIGAVLLLGLLILSLGWVLYLRLTDQPLRDPFGFYQPEKALPVSEPDGRQPPVMPPAEGMARVILAARPIQAYSRVALADLVDPVRGVFAYVDSEKEYVEKAGLITDLNFIQERVLKKDKRPGFGFTEDDFLPTGTRPGLVGGIPKGMRAVRLEGDVVEGIVGLRTGDHFDIVAAWGPKLKRAGTAPVGLQLTGPYSQQAQRSTMAGAPAALAGQPGSRVEVVVSNGVVVYPLDTRLIPTSSTGLMTGQVTGTRPVQEMVIAVPTESVAPLMAAISDESQLTCVARSGRTGGDSEDEMSGYDRAAQADSMPMGYDEGGFAIVETIVGGQRTLTAVPKVGSSTEDGEARAADDEAESDR